MTETYALRAVAHVRGGRAEPDDDDWGAVRCRIELDPQVVGPDALAGLQDFSHLEVVFVFDRLPESEVETGARRPRGRADWPRVGVFAQRGRNRPNRLGVSICRILEVGTMAVEVEGLDAIDGAPVLDLKPVMSGFLPRGPILEPAWAVELMAEYWFPPA
jgi:tRNA (adenine37-N6)-methyltransferase